MASNPNSWKSQALLPTEEISHLYVSAFWYFSLCCEYKWMLNLFFFCVLISGFSLPHSLSSYPLMGSVLPDPSHYPQLSHHTLHQPQKSESSLVGCNAPWDMDNMIQPIIGFTGAPGYQTGNSHTGMSLPFSFTMKWRRITESDIEFWNLQLCHVCLCWQVWTW